MFGGWGNYFFLTGSAAAGLIGLMFVVVTLTAGRERDELERGKKLYTTPIVWHLGIVLVLSGAAVAPAIPERWFALAALVIAVAGVAYGVYITRGILRAKLASSFSGYDALWYGLAPVLIYIGFAASGAGMLRQCTWAAPHMMSCRSRGILAPFYEVLCG